MTAASGADRVLVAACENVREPDGEPCTGLVRYRWGQPEAPCDTCGGRCGVAVAPWLRVEYSASGAHQPTVRDPVDVLDGIAAVLHQHCGPEVCVCVDDARDLLPLIEAREERAKAEGGAQALEQAALGAAVVHPDQGWCVPTYTLNDLAAALRGSTRGGT